MNTRFLRYLLANTLAIALPFSAATAAQKWNLAAIYPDSNFFTENLRWFADEVKKESKGELDIVVHSNASLFGPNEILMAVETGQVPMGEFVMVHYGNDYPIFNASGLPFLAKGYDEARDLWTLERPYVEKLLAQQGLMILWSAPWPGQGIFSKTQVNTVADFKGLRMRTDFPANTRLAELLKASPVLVRQAELPTAFSTGMISLMFSSATTGANSQAWEYADYFYDIQMNHPKNAVIVNKQAFDGLPEATQKVVMAVAQRAEERGWELSKEKSKTDRQLLENGGMKVIEASPEMISGLREVAAEIVDDWANTAGPDAKAIVEGIRAKQAK